MSTTSGSITQSVILTSERSLIWPDRRAGHNEQVCADCRGSAVKRFVRATCPQSSHYTLPAFWRSSTPICGQTCHPSLADSTLRTTTHTENQLETSVSGSEYERPYQVHSRSGGVHRTPDISPKCLSLDPDTFDRPRAGTPYGHLASTSKEIERQA